MSLQEAAYDDRTASSRKTSFQDNGDTYNHSRLSATDSSEVNGWNCRIITPPAILVGFFGRWVNNMKLIILICSIIFFKSLRRDHAASFELDSLRKYILEENSSILLNECRSTAKHRVSISRAQLLPNPNLGAIILPANLALAAVEMVLSFSCPLNGSMSVSLKTYLKQKRFRTICCS